MTLLDEDLAPLPQRDAADHRNDRQRIAAAFRALRKLGYTARMSDTDEAPNLGDKFVGWYAAQDGRAFGEGSLRSGELRGTLWLHWRGDVRKIVETLEAEGVRVLVGDDLTAPLALLPIPSNPHAFMAKPGAIEAGDWHRGCYVCGGQHSESKRKR